MNLANREREDREFHIKSLKRILVHVMGLDLKAQLEAGDGQPDPDEFVPLALVCGNHHLLQNFLGNKSEGSGPPAIPDEEYEKMSRRIESDMEPLDDDPFAGMSLTELLTKEDVQKLGIKVLDKQPGGERERHIVDIIDLTEK